MGCESPTADKRRQEISCFFSQPSRRLLFQSFPIINIFSHFSSLAAGPYDHARQVGNTGHFFSTRRSHHHSNWICWAEPVDGQTVIICFFFLSFLCSFHFCWKMLITLCGFSRRWHEFIECFIPFWSNMISFSPSWFRLLLGLLWWVHHQLVVVDVTDRPFGMLPGFFFSWGDDRPLCCSG